MSHNFFKFNNEDDYKTAKRHHLIVPNVSMIKNSGKIYINGAIPTRMNAEPGDIIIYDTNGHMSFIKPESFNNDICNTYTPVAIVVIPASHTSNGDIVGMSLPVMSTLHNGNEVFEHYWGDGINSITGYDGVVSVSLNDLNNNNATIFSAAESYLPSDTLFDNDGSIINPIDTYTKWSSEATVCSPSAYLNDESQSSLYLTSDVTNALQQMDGRENKPIEISESNKETYKAMYLCDSFAVSTYKPGHSWYLPSIGELGYLIMRLDKIQYALSQIEAHNTKNVKITLISENDTYWSSTQSSGHTTSWCVDTNTGKVYLERLNVDKLVRAFARF